MGDSYLLETLLRMARVEQESQKATRALYDAAQSFIASMMIREAIDGFRSKGMTDEQAINALAIELNARMLIVIAPSIIPGREESAAAELKKLMRVLAENAFTESLKAANELQSL
jgi:hypothetical protein